MIAVRGMPCRSGWTRCRRSAVCMLTSLSTPGSCPYPNSITSQPPGISTADAAENAADVAQTFGPAEERHVRLVTDTGTARLVAVPDVRGVRGNHVDPLRRHRGTRSRRTRCDPRHRGVRRGPREASASPRHPWRRTVRPAVPPSATAMPAAAGPDVAGSANASARARATPSSTIDSVSGRGISPSGVTVKGAPRTHDGR